MPASTFSDVPTSAPRPVDPLKVSHHFPPLVRDALVDASQRPDPFDRVHAIDAATAVAKARHPELFRSSY